MPKERSVQDFIDQLKEIYAEQEEILNAFEDEFGGEFEDDEDEEE